MIVISCNEKEKKGELNPGETSDAQCNCSALSDQCPPHSRAVISSSKAIPTLYTEHHVPQYGMLLWPLCASCPGSAPPHWPSRGTAKAVTCRVSTAQ